MDPDRRAGQADGLVAELYALPLEEFTAARDARARQLRADGDRQAAEQVKRLRKPSVAAWALNALARRHGAEVKALLAAGAELRDAQRRLLETGDRQALRATSARERELVEALAATAARELGAAGHPAGPALRERLFATLHAASADEQVRRHLAAGRLTGDHEISDLGFAAGFAAAGGAEPAPPGLTPAPSAPASAAAPSPPPAAEAPSTPPAAEAPSGPSPRELETARRRLAEAEADAERLAGQVTIAEDALAEAKRVLRDARARERRARERAAELQGKLRRLTDGS